MVAAGEHDLDGIIPSNFVVGHSNRSTLALVVDLTAVVPPCGNNRFLVLDDCGGRLVICEGGSPRGGPFRVSQNRQRTEQRFDSRPCFSRLKARQPPCPDPGFNRAVRLFWDPKEGPRLRQANGPDEHKKMRGTSFHASSAALASALLDEISVDRMRQKNSGTEQCNNCNKDFKHQTVPYTFCMLDSKTVTAFRFRECFVAKINDFVDTVTVSAHQAQASGMTLRSTRDCCPHVRG